MIAKKGKKTLKILSKSEIEEIVRFVLKYFNCDSEFKIFFEEASQEEHFEMIKEILGISEIDHKFTEEHGKQWTQEDRKKVPIYLEIVLNKYKEPINFVICIHPKGFSKGSPMAQRLAIIHEAKHIAEYPKTSKGDVSARDFEIMLLKEYLKAKQMH